MNIVTPVPTAIPFTTSNVNTESARRDNVQREVIPQLSQPENSSAEAGLGSESDRLKQSAKSAQPAQAPTYERPVVQQNPNADTSGLNNTAGDTPDNAKQESAGKEDAEERQKQQKEAADKQELERLKTRDQEVRAHEQAHAAVGGQYAGSPSYEFETGPDGQQYAVGGEVSIDISKESEPEDTLNKMQQVKAAALAPAEPSPQDFRVASEATRIAAEARVEIAQDEIEQQKDAQQESIDRVFGRQDNSAAEAIEETIPELDEIVDPGDVGAPTRSLERPEQFVDNALNAFLSQQNGEETEINSQRDEEITQRALRIANFYQQTSTPRTEGFQQFA
ncbi:putative metalloprotease CJM1_0395 family protein [Planctobacterium marinum]|uniref:putative metalloprotease CJM1_0395 family protein n=1 Tax=Planctobacterium marinum TaxID=1631968 RepID=UPI001E54F50F|nr:putative metalloprotease CJM1_0395 family protein [Planctobacterium marinum]MCC2606470.1 hypothetical protein [Planctobacterium marinum]